MSNVLDAFNKSRAAAQAKMNKSSSGPRKFFSQNEVSLCGNKNVGMFFGAYIWDTNSQPFRIIEGYRTFRINKDVAEKYGIKNYQLRLCNPSNYVNPTDEQLAVVTKLDKMLEQINNDWGAWKDKLSPYPPTWNKHLTIQYMKLTRRSDNNGVDVQGFEPGVKVITSRSDAYFRTFDEFINSQNVINGGMDFVTNMLSRDVRQRQTSYMIKSSFPEGSKSYVFAIQELQRAVEITDEDLRAAQDLYKEVVDVTEGAIDVEELNKWLKLFRDTYIGIKNGVMGTVDEPIADAQIEVPTVSAPVTPTPTPEPVVEANVAPVTQTAPVTSEPQASIPDVDEFDDLDDPFKD